MDVTVRVTAESALRLSEAHNRALLDAIPDLIFGLDAQGTLLNCRAAKNEDLHLPQAEFLGKNVTEVLPDGIGDRAMEYISAALATGETQTFEYQLSVPESGLGEYECRLVKCGDQEVLAIVRNITERKRAERVAETTRNLALKLSGVRDVRKGARLCLEAAIKASSMDCGGVYLTQDDAKVLELAVHVGFSADFAHSVRRVPCDSGPGRLLVQGKPIFRKYCQVGAPLSPTQRREGLKATAVIPVLQEDRLVACLNVASHSQEEVPDWARAALEMIGAQIGNTLARLRAEEAVRREHSLVTRMMETSPAGITLVDRQGQIVFANACAERILGATKKQITQRRHNAPAWHITDYDGNPLPDDKLPFATVLERSEPVYDVRYAIAGRDGQRVLLRTNAAPLFGESGQVDGMVAAIEDVTDMVKAERSLRESEERFRAIFENAVLGVYRTAADGRILMANPSLVRMLGYASFEEMADINVEADGYAAGNSRSEFKAKMEADGRVVGNESTWVRRDGTALFVRENARVVRDERGNILYYEGTVEDITHRKRAEAALMASERNYREIFNATSEAIFVHDPASGAILDVNDTMAHMTGRSYEESLAMGLEVISSASPPYSKQEAQQWIRKAAEEGPQRFEWLAKRKDGHQIWVEVSLKHTRIGGRPRVLAMLRDISARKQAEQAEQQHLAELTRAWHANAMGEMASGLAHELNQPLCAIQNYASGCLRLAGKKSVDMKTLRDSIGQIGNQAERAAGIIKRIRGLVGKREPRRSTLDIKTLLSDAVGLIEKEAAQHNVTVVPELAGRLPKIQADDVEIEQVALNLMRNAIEAMGDKRVAKRTLTIAASVPEKGTVEVAIKDTGRGLPPKLTGTVFDSFFTTKEEGLGIGLSLSRRIIEAHGGRLWAESDGQSGATFRFTLPVAGDKHGKFGARRLCRR
jgi:PAS domain S-box-containing protein